MTRPNVSHIEFTRKPSQFDDIYTTVKRSALPAGLATYTTKELGLTGKYCLNDFASTPKETIFLATAIGSDWAGAATYLVNTEGSNYARYMTKVVD